MSRPGHFLTTRDGVAPMVSRRLRLVAPVLETPCPMQAQAGTHPGQAGRAFGRFRGPTPASGGMHRNGGNSEARRLAVFVMIAAASLTSWRMWSETPWPEPRTTNDPDWPKGTYSFSPDAFAIAYPNSHSGAAPTCQVGVFLLVKRSLRSVVRPARGVLQKRTRCPGMLVACISSIGDRRRLGRVLTISTHQIAPVLTRSRNPDSPPAAPPFVLGRGVMFNELSDVEWHALRDLICDRPVRTERRGRPQVEQRTLTNAVLWVLFTGESWSKLPMQYPSVPTCRRKLNEWRESGMLDTILKRLQQSGRDISACAGQISKPARSTPCGDTDRLRGVFWTNPASWKPPVAVR